MSILQRSLLLITAVLFVAACAAGGSASQVPVPSGGGPVTTADEAVARVIESEPRLAGIGKRDPDMIGQANWYEVAPASGVGAFIVTVRLGWGDCQAGCIDEHTWVYAVLPDGTVNLQSEGGPAVPPDAWPAPGAGGDGRTGVHIVAVAGPTCPVETVPPDPNCAPKPVPNATAVIIDAADGVQDLFVVLDAAGEGFVELEPGDYSVTAQAVGGFMNGPEPQRVVVEDGRISEVTLTFDTGIR